MYFIYSVTADMCVCEHQNCTQNLAPSTQNYTNILSANLVPIKNKFMNAGRVNIKC